MQTMPAIGMAVSFAGNSAIGACKGTVVRCYPGYRGKNEDGEFVVDDMVAVEVASLPYAGRPFCLSSHRPQSIDCCLGNAHEQRNDCS